MNSRPTWLLMSAALVAILGIAASAPTGRLETRQTQGTLPIPDAEKTHSAQGSLNPTWTLPAESDQAPSAETTPAPQPSAGNPVHAERLIFLAADGVKLVGTLYLPVEKKEENKDQVYPGVILLPMHVETRQDWEWLALWLAEEKFAVLALDLRGQGESVAQPDWQKATGDVLQVWRELASRPDVDEKRLAILGASMGANLALNAAAAEPGISTVVLFSPGLNYSGVTSNQALEKIGNRRLLVIASREDALAGDWPSRMMELAPGKVELRLVEGTAHGSQLLQTPARLERTVLQWLAGRYAAPIAPSGQRFNRAILMLALLACSLESIILLVAILLFVRWLRQPKTTSQIIPIARMRDRVE